MNTLEYVLDGLEQWLEVERECGARILEVDRSLLSPAPSPEPAAEMKAPRRPAAPEAAPVMASARPPSELASTVYDFVFLHDRPLSPAGNEMMAKIVAAMGKTTETAPVVVDPPLPRARIYIVLGGLALKKHFPGTRGEPGKWAKTADGKEILITYSPLFILRFPTVTDAVMKTKREMWNSLKVAMQKISGGKDGR